MATAKTNCTINGKDYFQITRTVPFQNADGTITKKKKKFYGSSESDAKRKYDQWLQNYYQSENEKKEAETQKRRAFENVTLQDRAEEYVDNVLKVSQEYAKGTIDLYVGAYTNYIKDSSLSMMKVKDLEPLDVQKFYNNLDVSQQKLKAIHKFMRAFVKWLCLNNYSSDFLAGVSLPKKEDNSRHDEIITWSEEEVKQLLAAMSRQNRHRQYFLVHLLLYSGLRISEALALKYDDIRDGIIHVERQYYLGELKPPKWNSDRLVPLHDNLVEPFRIHKEWHEIDREKNGYEDTGYIFTTSTGSLYDPSIVRKALKRFYRDNGIEYKPIHSFRATFCTQLCRCGVSLEAACKLLGHKSIETTAAHYALVKNDTLEDAIASLSY